MTTIDDTRKLVKRETAIAALFGPDDCPSPRTWESWKKARLIPFVRLGRLHFYDVAAVREALAARFTVNATKNKG